MGLSPPDGSVDVESPRWVADEMLGRLARYLRFFGHDTVYVRGIGDGGVAALAHAQGRILITRDRELARRVDGSLWLTVTAIDDQLRAVRARFPNYPYALVFDRCTACNGRLQPLPWDRRDEARPAVPAAVWTTELAVFACNECHHPYWEGSHTAGIRAHLARTFAAT
jgi:uncharacterized protein